MVWADGAGCFVFSGAEIPLGVSLSLIGTLFMYMLVRSSKAGGTGYEYSPVTSVRGVWQERSIERYQCHLRHEEITHYFQPNGSGKSTLLKCIYCVLIPRRGDIFRMKHLFKFLTIRESAKQIAVLMQQNDNSFDLSSEQIVPYGAYAI